MRKHFFGSLRVALEVLVSGFIRIVFVEVLLCKMA